MPILVRCLLSSGYARMVWSFDGKILRSKDLEGKYGGVRSGTTPWLAFPSREISRAWNHSGLFVFLSKGCSSQESPYLGCGSLWKKERALGRVVPARSVGASPRMAATQPRALVFTPQRLRPRHGQSLFLHHTEIGLHFCTALRQYLDMFMHLSRRSPRNP